MPIVKSQPRSYVPTRHRSARDELAWYVRASRAPRLRTMREFAEQEIVLPDGPFEGRRFRVDRQPYTGLWLDAIAGGGWTRFASTGPSQSGKTLLTAVLPVLYHLFEIGETVIFGLPDMDMARDKWEGSLRPVIERTRYRELIPRSGAGSRGGIVTKINFRNGASLRFMSGGGGDKARAAFTSRVLVVTEVDALDVSSSTSHEADKLKQLEARTRAYGARRRIYLECTVSTEEGRIWQEYQGGTASRIVLPCPHCAAWVSPEREHLHGWQEAATAIDARQQAAFACPACGKPWTDAQRIEANQAGRLVHRGQEIGPDGAIHGTPTPTETLGFRWSAVNNLFNTPGDLGADEWRAQRERDEENAEKELDQFVWCRPHQPPRWDATPLDAHVLRRRYGVSRKGFVPDGSDLLTLAVDLGKRVGWWSVYAWSYRGQQGDQQGLTGQVIDYGTLEVAGDTMDEDRAVLAALRDFRDDWTLRGWASPDGTPRLPDQVWIDAGYQPEAVYAFIRESDPGRFRPCVGLGVGQAYARN
ncbi:MAG TPA: terminase gpA endonuclease subunit, partial [Phycisphaerae bacterium]|nr:terminase gpA endonuclease subunit [Phycisphaerae bacterium]